VKKEDMLGGGVSFGVVVVGDFNWNFFDQGNILPGGERCCRRIRESVRDYARDLGRDGKADHGLNFWKTILKVLLVKRHYML
jgi:hypothetical protein